MGHLLSWSDQNKLKSSKFSLKSYREKQQAEKLQKLEKSKREKEMRERVLKAFEEAKSKYGPVMDSEHLPKKLDIIL